MTDSAVLKLVAAMMRAERVEAKRLIDELLVGGATATQVISEVLDPALVQLGILWKNETVSLAQTFVAAKIAEDVLMCCMPEENEIGFQIPKGIVVIGNIEDDFHSLGRRIVASFLRVNGWVVHDLGNDVPAELFVERALELKASVIGISAMMQTTALNIRKVRDIIDTQRLSSRLKLAVGGAVFNWRPELVEEVGGDGSTQNALDANSLFWRLQVDAVNGGQA